MKRVADDCTKKLEAEVFRLQKRIARLEQENIDLRAINEEFARALIDNETALGISRFKDSVMVYMNNTCLNMLGYKWDEVIGKSAWDLNLWVDIEEREIVLNEFSKRGYAREVECRFRKKMGGYVVTLATTSIFNVDGVQYMILSGQDISASKPI
ncbi:MAG TPA: PAS domain S-box protein [Syntrophomonadaceae bacterium]|nr:PAS domain S-box protein [Syntrophomonadaceae bacterium]